MEVKILAMAPSASRKTVMAESWIEKAKSKSSLILKGSSSNSTWPVCPFLKFVTICIILPARKLTINTCIASRKITQEDHRNVGSLPVPESSGGGDQGVEQRPGDA